MIFQSKYIKFNSSKKILYNLLQQWNDIWYMSPLFLLVLFLFLCWNVVKSCVHILQLIPTSYSDSSVLKTDELKMVDIFWKCFSFVIHMTTQCIRFTIMKLLNKISYSRMPIKNGSTLIKGDDKYLSLIKDYVLCMMYCNEPKTRQRNIKENKIIKVTQDLSQKCIILTARNLKCSISILFSFSVFPEQKTFPTLCYQ